MPVVVVSGRIRRNLFVCGSSDPQKLDCFCYNCSHWHEIRCCGEFGVQCCGDIHV